MNFSEYFRDSQLGYLYYKILVEMYSRKSFALVSNLNSLVDCQNGVYIIGPTFRELALMVILDQ